MDSVPACSLKSDPDISGIGVRAAIYVQNLISFIPAIQALWDGEVTVNELDTLQDQATTILLTAFAILISAIVEARTTGITPFHAHVILSLSWMNNTNAFIYFILFVQRKTNLPRKAVGRVGRRWKSWWREITKEFSNNNRKVESDIESRALKAFLLAMEYALKRIVFILGSLHLSLMAALGVWLWSNPSSFSFSSPGSDSSHPPCSIDDLSISILGRSVFFGSKVLQGASLVIYSVFLLPLLNLALPAILFLFLTFLFHGKPLSAFIGLAVLLIVNIVFVADIELTLANVRGYQDGNEASWTFGQVIALLLLVLPLRGFIPVETLVDRKIKRRAEETELHLAVERGSDSEVDRLLERGVDPNALGGRYHNPLIAASRDGHRRIVQLLLDKGADVNIESERYGSALQAALGDDHFEIVKLLLERRADVNTRSGKHGDVLQAASVGGQTEIVKLLLNRGVDVNVQGGTYGNALQAACALGHLDIVKLLIEGGANMNLGGRGWKSALLVACVYEKLDIVTLLLELGADVDGPGGVYGNVLQTMCVQGEANTIKLLLEHGANVNALGEKNRTALHTASSRGNLDIVRLLLKHGAAVDARDDQKQTPLHAAERIENADVMRLLLEHGADANARSIDGKTPLHIAVERGSAKMVRELLAHGAAIDARDSRNESPVDIATSNGDLNMARLLLNHGATTETLG